MRKYVLFPYKRMSFVGEYTIYGVRNERINVHTYRTYVFVWSFTPYV